MAALRSPRMASAVSSLLPRLSSPVFFRSAMLLSQSTQPSVSPLIPVLTAVPGILQGIPALLGDIWEGILRAVPKKKTSHMKKRHRQMAGKALKDVNNLNKCPVCGQTKKMHTLCSSCLRRAQDAVREGAISKATKEA